MQVVFCCPGCQRTQAAGVTSATAQLHCEQCDWAQGIPAAVQQGAAPAECLVCGCRDLWRQKDFPQSWGVALVALAAGLSTIAWAWYLPELALGILMGFALLDLLLYLFMPDVLVCYRCAARFRSVGGELAAQGFNLETAERYRQEQHRLQQHPSHPN